MLKLLINYDYTQYPYTTASYIEDVAKREPGIVVSRLECPAEQAEPFFERYPQKRPDFILNIMPVPAIPICSNIPSAYWEIDCHLVKGTKNEFYKLVDRIYIPQLPFLGYYPPEKTKILPLGAAPDIHKPMTPNCDMYDVGFVGNDTYPIRIKLLDSLAKKFKVLRTQTPPREPYAQALSNCKIIFNHSLEEDVNMRFFEAMSCGRLLLTDYLPQQDDFAVIGEHYDIFETEAELHSKVAEYLKDEKTRETMQGEARNNIQKRHSYRHRLFEILEDYKCNLS